MIRKLGYSKIQVSDISVAKLKKWSLLNLKSEVQQLEINGWNMEDPDTWKELVFINFCLDWYGKKVALFLTDSYVDFRLANSVIDSKAFSHMRKTLGVDAQVVVLLDNTIFLEPEDLDTIYISIDFSKGFASLDLSGYDEEGELENSLVEEYGWLTDTSSEWTGLQKSMVFSKDYSDEYFEEDD